MGQLGTLLGKTVRTVMFVRGVLAVVAGAVLVVAGIVKWELKMAAFGVLAMVFGVWYVRRSRVPRSYEDQSVLSALPAPTRPARPARPAVVTPPRPVAKPAEPLVPRVEQRPPVEYATDDGGPRFLR